MREMMYAEWSNARFSISRMLLRVGAFAVVGLLIGGPAMLCFLIIMPSVLLPRILCASDASEQWAAYRMTLPAGRTSAVASRFLLALVCNAVLALACAASMLVCCFTLGTMDAMLRYGTILLFCEAGALAFSGLMLAVSYRWNIDKANYIVTGLIALGWVCLAAGSRIESIHTAWQAVGAGLSAWLAGNGLAISFLLVGCAAIVFGLCYWMSVHFYQKKEL